MTIILRGCLSGDMGRLNEYFWKPEMVAFVGELQSRWSQERSRYSIVESPDRPGVGRLLDFLGGVLEGIE